MSSILDYQHFHLVGIKGVAMTSLAQCLVDAGKTVTGSDVTEEFVTQPLLDNLNLTLQTSFSDTLPAATECVIYTAAHGAQDNPQVRAAEQQSLPTWSHAQALAKLANLKQPIAVCGVGGKSTTSGMLAWIFQHSEYQQSFAVGVGDIPQLHKTGQWLPRSQYMIVEADEYVTDPVGARQGTNFVPRFSYLKPFVIICTNLKFDHPDVYRDFEHTRNTYQAFFEQLRPSGFLIVNGDDSELLALAQEVSQTRPDISLITYGEGPNSHARLSSYAATAGRSQATFTFHQEQEISLPLPGKFNVMNALAAVTAVEALHHSGASPVPSADALTSLASFPSTKRRSEYIGEKKGIKYYDDYAHHPNEVAQIITAFKEWFPQQRLVVAFQAHTFSRTKELFSEFVDALSQASEVVMTDIFASAREEIDDSVSSESLCQAINQQHPATSCHNLKNNQQLAEWCRSNLQPGDVLLTVGAGDIYQVHELL